MARRAMVLVVAVSLTLASAPAADATSGTMLITVDTTLTEDHDGSIVIDADDVTLDCAGHSVTGSGDGVGIALQSHSGVTVIDCLVTGFGSGIAVRDANGNELIRNVARGNGTGIEVTDSSAITLQGNLAVANDGVGFSALRADYLVFKANTARRNGDAGFELGSAFGNELSNNESLRNDEGFRLTTESTFNILRSNTANHNRSSGFGAYRSSNRNQWRGNRAMANKVWGFLLDDSDHNTVTRNHGCRNGRWDALDDGYQNVWTRNDFCRSSI